MKCEHKSERSLAHFGSSVIMCEGPPSQAQELAPLYMLGMAHHHHLQHYAVLFPYDEVMVYNMLPVCNDGNKEEQLKAQCSVHRWGDGRRAEVENLVAEGGEGLRP